MFFGDGGAVYLKNEVEEQTLIFMVMKLNTLGMKVRKVFYSNQNLENSMEPLKEQLVQQGDGGTLQVFSATLYPFVFEKTIFTFVIQIEGSVTDFSYQLADRLLKKQLWMAVKGLQWTDIDLVVKSKKICAHKCILAARSPVFAAEFAKDENINQIVIDDVDYSTVEQFLYFLYTGETNNSLANEQLFKFANRYELTTLASLCNNALGQINAEQMMRSLISLHPKNDPMPSFEIRPTKDTELYFDPNTSTFLVDWIFSYQVPEEVVPQFFEYQNEKLFSVHITQKSACGGELRLICTKHPNSGFEVVETFYSVKNNENQHQISQWMKMERRNVQEHGLIFIFSSTPPSVYRNISYTISFRIKIASSIENYRYELMDTTSAPQLWSAATNRHLTDVEIFVGSRKFEVHRVVLSARSPVFDAQLNKDTNIDVKPSIIINDNVDPDIFQHFLEFLYTGILKLSAYNKQLIALAETYEVETLKMLCQVNRELDADKVTTSILAV